MKKGTLLVGEPMGLFIAQNTGPFEDVDSYYSATAGAEFNVAIGIRRLGHPVGYYTKLGNDPFGKRIVKMMNEENISTGLISISLFKKYLDHVNKFWNAMGCRFYHIRFFDI